MDECKVNCNRDQLHTYITHTYVHVQNYVKMLSLIYDFVVLSVKETEAEKTTLFLVHYYILVVVFVIIA